MKTRFAAKAIFAACSATITMLLCSPAAAQSTAPPYVQRGCLYREPSNLTNEQIASYCSIFIRSPGAPQDYIESAMYVAARAYEAMGNYEKAGAYLERLTQLEPGDFNANYELCLLLGKTGVDLQYGYLACTRIAQNHSAAVILDARALIDFRLGNYTDAIGDATAALQANSQLASSLYVRGLAKAKTGDSAGGNADIAAAQGIDPKIADTYAGYGVKP